MNAKHPGVSTKYTLGGMVDLKAEHCPISANPSFRSKDGNGSFDVIDSVAYVGRRFAVELESGKETIHAGKHLNVLDTLGIDLNIAAQQELEMAMQNTTTIWSALSRRKW